MNTRTSLQVAPGGRTPIGVAIAAATAVIAAVVVACVPVTPPPSYALRTTLTMTGFTVDWDAPDGTAPDVTYDVQSKTGAGAWVDEPVAATTEFDFVAPAPGKYAFRVRITGTAEWSAEATSTFVHPELPVLTIETNGRAPIVDKENYLQATIALDPNGSDLPAYSGTTEIKGRGNSTWMMPKKPYRLKLTSKAPLGGMPSSRHWVLLANYLDKSQLRNATALDISAATSLVWTPKYRFVEVVLNGSYDGVYVLVEQVRSASDRVPITEMKPEDIAEPAVTGGYLLEMDDKLEQNTEPGWRTTKNVPIVVKEPEPAGQQQMDYIRAHVQAFEDALFSDEFADPDLGYRAHIDVGSLVDYYIVNELTKNNDALWRSSTFMWKERGDELLHFGPVWDFDASLAGVITSVLWDGWFTRILGVWMPRFFQDPTFEAAVAARWQQLRPAFETIPDTVIARGAALAPAVQNDLLRWDATAAGQDNPAYIAGWLDNRIDWISGQYPG